MMTSGRFFSRLAFGAALITAIGPAYGLRQVQGPVMLPPGGFAGDWVGPFPTDDPANNNQTLPGFTVAASGKQIQDTPAGEAIRLMQAGEWVQAIQAIESLDTADPSMVVDGRGILRPLSSLKSVLIASLPEDGRRVFRRLNDPAAASKLSQALALPGLTERAQALNAVVQDYAICDASAQAANALGDIRFEQGRFDEAAAVFRFCADHPGYDGDQALLMAKRLVALARTASHKPFDDLAEYAAFRYPDTHVQLGGQAVPMATLIDQLASSRGQTSDGPAATGTQTIAMPDLDAPAFDKWLIAPDLQARLDNQLMGNRSGVAVQDHITPVVAADGQRLFTLALASIARLDPQTGSELWRVGDQSRHAEQHNLQHQISRGSYHQALVLTDAVLLAVSPDQHLLERSNGATQSNLTAIDPDTGEVRWRLDQSGESLANYNCVGTPIVADKRIYAVMQRPGNPQLTLAVIRLGDGKVQSTLELGNVAQDPRTNRPMLVSPRLAMGRDYLFVQTHSGGLIAVDRAGSAIAWAFTEPVTQAPMMRGRFRRGHMIQPSPTPEPCELVTRDGLVIAKDAQSDTVHALREYDAAPVWSVRTGQDAAIVHADARHVYVLGEELVAYDLKTGEPAWWTRLPGQHAGRPVFADDACLIAGDRRFCRIDLATGKLTHYRNDAAGPADLARVGPMLIQSTPDSVMGYPLPAAPDR